MFHRLRAPVLAALLPFSLLARPLAAGDDFPPVDPAELAASAPLVEKDADAEVLDWKMKFEDFVTFAGEGQTRQWHALRIKVFTPRAQDTLGKVDIPYSEGDTIAEIAGRTILPDGTILPLKKDAIYERTLVKADGLKVNVKSFALPGVAPGAILEYRWRRDRRSHFTHGERVELQREIPVRKLTLSVQSLFEGTRSEYSMRAEGFGIKVPEFVSEKGGFQTAVFTNLASFREEPKMPPESLAKRSLLLYYAKNWESGELFWTDYVKRLHEQFEDLTKPNRTVRDAAEAAVSGAATPEEKVKRLFDLARARVVNVTWKKKTGIEEKKRKENKSPGDTLERGEGTSSDVNYLFAAFARAAGLDTRLAALSSRREGYLSREARSAQHVHGFAVAVRIGDAWRLFDPGAARVPFGMLRWDREGQLAILSDPKPKELTWIRVPDTPAEASRIKRIADLTLEEDGTVEGDVRVEETGHFAVARRERDDEAKEREKVLKDALTERLKGAEVSAVVFDESNDTSRPYTTSYHVRVPGFAQRVGSRLVVQPAYFQAGKTPLFTASVRTLPVFFPYASSEEDDVTLRLPQGFASEAIAPAPPMTIKDLGAYETTLTADASAVKLHRSYRFGGVLVPPASYPQIKKVFDELHERDERRLTLRTAK